MRSTRRRIDLAADPLPNNASRGIYEIAVDAGVMVFVFFKHMKIATRSDARAFAGGNGTVDNNLIPEQEIGALLRERNSDAGIVWRDFVEQAGRNVDWILALDQFTRWFHRARYSHDRSTRMGTEARSRDLRPRINQRQSGEEAGGRKF